MRRRARSALAALLLALAAGVPAAAQQAAVFELDDYVDPQLLGAIVEEGEIVPGNRFLVVRLLSGTAEDMEHQGFYTNGRTNFLHAGASFYDGAHQWDVEATRLPEVSTAEPNFSLAPSPGRGRIVPRTRFRVQYGRYLAALTQREDGEQHGGGYIGRGLVSLGYDQLPDGRGLYDFGLYVDVPLSKAVKQLGKEPRRSSKGFTGGVGYNWRVLENGYDQHRFLYYYSFGNQPWRTPYPALRIATPVRFSFGGERTEGHWRLAPVRLELGTRAALGRTSLHLSYAISARTASEGYTAKVNHELAAFVDVVAFSRLLPPRP